MQDPDAGAREEYSGTGKGARAAGESEQQGGWQEMRSVRWPGATLGLALLLWEGTYSFPHSPKMY